MSIPSTPPPALQARADVLALALLEAPAHTPLAPRMQALFQSHHLKPRQQKRVRDVMHRLHALSGILDWAIPRAAPHGLAPQVVPRVRLLACHVLSGEISVAQAAAALPFVDWNTIARARTDAEALADPAERVHVLAGVPRALAVALCAELGDDAVTFARALHEAAPVCIRANVLQIDRDALRARLQTEGVATAPTAVAAHGLLVTSPARLFRTPSFHAGLFELQDEGSQLVAELVAPEPGHVVVDACAGAGGKTLALASMMRDRGEILALDSDASRLRELRPRLARAGVRGVRAQRVAAHAWPEHIAALVRRADRVLIDAPCSGLGALRRSPETRAWLRDADLVALAAVQRDLAERAARLLRPGARLVYATCSVLRAENEDVVEALLANHALRAIPPHAVLGPRAAAITDPSGRFLRTWPHHHGCDGFFAAVLERVSS